MTDSPSSDSKCVVCLKDIPEGAQICAECNSYQDFRRHVFAYGGLLGALIAIIPLWSAATSLTKLAFPPSSEISLRELQCRSEGLSLFVLNSGGQPAHLFKPRLKLMRDDEPTDLEFGLSVPTGNAKIEANSLVGLSFKLLPGQTLPIRSESKSCEITFLLDSIDPTSDTAATADESCSCPD